MFLGIFLFHRTVTLSVICPETAVFLNKKSGRRDSNSRMLAWEANALPLGYSRIKTQNSFSTTFLILPYPDIFAKFPAVLKIFPGVGLP